MVLRGLANQQAETSVGIVEQVTGSSFTCRLDKSLIGKAQASGDDGLSKIAGVGANLKMRVGGVWVIGEIREVALAKDGVEDTLIAKLSFIGEGPVGDDGRLQDFQRGVSFFPEPGGHVYAIHRDDLLAIFNSRGRPAVEIGAVYPTLRARAPVFVDPLLSKHFAVFGSTGTGKSTLVAALLHNIIARYPAAHVVLIDPHGEYSRAFPSDAHVFNIDNLKLPYWLMNFEEHCEALVTSGGEDYELDKEILGKCLLKARGLNDEAKTVTNLNVATPLPYSIFDLLTMIDAEMGKLEKLTKTSSYLRLKIRLEDLMRDKRFNFMFGQQLYSQSLAGVVGGLLRMPNQGKPLSIIDMSGIPSEVVSVVVALISRIVLDYAIWSRGEALSPVLLMCEEAQRYLPAHHIAQHTAAETVLQRIAKEGRKYGVSLGIICQRPSDLSEAVLSQCGTVISTRLNNARDQQILRDALPDSHQGMTDSIQSLRNRECIICGEAVALPIRVRVDELAPDLRPHSDDPVYSELWRDAPDERQKLERVVSRWVKHAL